MIIAGMAIVGISVSETMSFCWERKQKGESFFWRFLKAIPLMTLFVVSGFLLAFLGIIALP
jgi:hypothetical protein